MKATFTEDTMRRLSERRGERVVVHDPKLPGLRAELRPAGTVSFSVVRRMRGGGPVRVTIGSWPAITVDAARTVARGHLLSLAQGVNPNDTAREIKEQTTLENVTFGELFELMLTLPAKKGGRRTTTPRRAKTVDEYVRLRDRFLSAWLKRKAHTITNNEVAERHRAIGVDSGPYQANRVLAVVVATFEAGIERKRFSGDNPAVGGDVSRFAETSRERRLTADELPQFWRALDVENELFRDFFRLALLTGARRSNLQAMAWQDVDLHHQVWSVPGAQSKNGSPLVVVLPPPAIEILTRRKRESDGSPFVFPSSGSTGHLIEPKTAWQRICKRAGLPDLRLHDLRRSLGSWMALDNTSLKIVGEALGHRSTASTEVYARLSKAPVAEAVARATANMMAVVQAAQDAEKSSESGEAPAKTKKRAH